MLVRLKREVNLSPLEFATRTHRGGLPQGGPPRVDLPRGDYSRSTREFIPRGGSWRARRARRVGFPAVRLFPRGGPPGGPGGVIHPTGRAVPPVGDPHPESQLFWRAKFNRMGPAVHPRGTPEVEVHLPGRKEFPLGSRAVHPRKQADPFLFQRGWSTRVAPPGTPRGGLPLVGQLRGLHRRVRLHELTLTRVARLEGYRTGLFGRGRRKLKLKPCRRYLLFRRRRLRGVVLKRITPANYFKGMTRQNFRTPRVNKFTWFEKVTSLGGPHLEGLTGWVSWTFGGRISTPLEYNHYQRTGFFFRVHKRRPRGGRRWKLGQHPRWGALYHQARSVRWGWFAGTPLGGLIARVRETPPGEPPETTGLAAQAYWSVRRWGRSRWDRPTGRAAHVFAHSVKQPPGVEHDALQWGGASTSGTGVLLGLETQLSLAVHPRRHPPRGAHSRRGWRTNWPTRWVWRWLVTPVWWVYSGLAGLVCWSAWWGRRFVFLGVGLSRGVLLGGSTFTRGVTRGITREITRVVKETPLVKTISWGVTSWSLAYSAENSREGMNTPWYDYQEAQDPYAKYELDHPRDVYPDYDQLGHGTWTDFPGESPFKQGWLNNDPGEFLAPLEELGVYLREEIPYRVGFLVGPVLDALVRYPGWSLLEGVSLVTLGGKLHFQRRWSELLGSRWAFPAVVLRRVINLVVWLGLIYLVGSQLSYSTLRVGLTYSGGFPWREEYYLFWWVGVSLGVTRLVGPTGVKNFLFHQLGWSNLVGLTWGAVEAAPPEEYQPGRPPGGLLTRTFSQGFRIKPAGNWYRGAISEDRTRMWGKINPGGLDLQINPGLEISREGEPAHDYQVDQETYWFVYPGHLTPDEENSLYPGDLPDPTAALLREPLHRGTSRYELEWTHRGEIFIPQLLPPYAKTPTSGDIHHPGESTFTDL